MPLSTSIVGIITAAATMITAVGGLLLALANFRTKRAVDQVHTIVNQQRTDMLLLIANQQQYNRRLVAALKIADVDVPADQSIEPPH